MAAKNLHRKSRWALLLLVVLLVAATIVNAGQTTRETQGEDIYYSWVEGQRLLAGENPYARVLTGNMRENQKYATYFPLFYILSAASQIAGLRDYPQWVSAWRIVFTLFDLAIGVLVFWLLYRRQLVLAALFGAAFWLFNRWTLHVVQVAHMDFITIFLFLLSLALFDRHRSTSLLLLSFSLAIKQIAVFTIPLYLIWTWQAAKPERAVRDLGQAVLLIASVPVIVSLPFLVWNAEGLVKSVVFSATRFPADHFGAPSVDGLLGWIGIPAKAPMLIMMALAYGLAWRRQVGLYIGALFVMASFVDFNSVLFRQYLAWVVPLLPLVLVDVVDGRLQFPTAREPGV